MYTFACVLLDALFKEFLRQVTQPRRRNATLVRAVTFAPETVAYQPDERISASVDPEFPRKWLALDKRIHASCQRDEAEYLLELEERNQVNCGKEAESWIYLRRLYHNEQTHQLVS